MPWKPNDARKHKKGLTAHETHEWAEAGNEALKEYGSKSAAIRVANSAVNKHRHHHDHRHPDQFHD